MFIYDGDNTTVKLAVKYANSNDYWSILKEEVYTKDYFDMSTLNPIQVFDSVYSFYNQNAINVKVYYPKWRWSRAIGYFTPSRPLDINLNGYRLNRSVNSIIGTLFHELTHMADNNDTNNSYGHGSNNPSGKANTAPYFIGNVFTNKNNTENATYTKYVPWWKKLWRWIF